jgi:hypothetical protein
LPRIQGEEFPFCDLLYSDIREAGLTRDSLTFRYVRQRKSQRQIHALVCSAAQFVARSARMLNLFC